MLLDILQTESGQILISILLGVGLATIFRKVCKDNSCMIIKGPPVKETNKYYYKIDNDCFKYTPQATECKK